MPRGAFVWHTGSACVQHICPDLPHTIPLPRQCVRTQPPPQPRSSPQTVCRHVCRQSAHFVCRLSADLPAVSLQTMEEPETRPGFPKITRENAHFSGGWFRLRSAGRARKRSAPWKRPPVPEPPPSPHNTGTPILSAAPPCPPASLRRETTPQVHPEFLSYMKYFF